MTIDIPKGVLFDLDQTLIDSSSLEYLRNERKWQEIYGRISSLKPYPGISEILDILKRLDCRVGIVTSAPTPYCSRILTCFGWKVDAKVCYHDTSRHKPHPDPLLKGLELLRINACDCISIGDSSDDIIASKAAQIFSIAALWGSRDPQSTINVQPDHICLTTQDLRSYLLEFIPH